MIRATWNGTVIAESDRTRRVEGNQYFPMEDIHTDLLTDSSTHTRCPWKGRASYYNVVVNGEVNPDAAWTYPKPTFLARGIKGHVAFWRGVQVQEVDDPVDSADRNR
jgi:uncharacterized protein (DUF427 family)